MDVNSFISLMIQKVVDVNIIQEEAELLKTDDTLIEFCENNPQIINQVSPSALNKFFLLTSSKMLEKKFSIPIVKNIYNPYSVIYAICMHTKSLPKSLFNKISKIFYQTIANSSNFDIVVKDPMKHSRAKVYKSDFPMEFFWLIPLFVNTEIFKIIDTEQFIFENKAIAKRNPEYIEGYEFYVLNLSSQNKNDYKQYLYEGIKTLQ